MYLTSRQVKMDSLLEIFARASSCAFSLDSSSLLVDELLSLPVAAAPFSSSEPEGSWNLTCFFALRDGLE